MPTGWMAATARFSACFEAHVSVVTPCQCLQGWKLVVTGHSLGAGAAALISLKIHDRYPGGPCFLLTADVFSLACSCSAKLRYLMSVCHVLWLWL